MYRTCLLAAALLLAGCSEPNHVPPAVARDPLAIGTEIFLTQRAVDRLDKISDACRMAHFVVGTKVRIIEVPSNAPYLVVRGLILDGQYAGHNVVLFRDELCFAP